MNWCVILEGSQWRALSSEIFQEHRAVSDWSTVSCDDIDVLGDLVELRRPELKLLVPQRSIVAAINVQDAQIAQKLGIRDASVAPDPHWSR